MQHLIETALYGVLSSDSAILALVDNRLYAGQAPPQTNLPYLVFQWVDGALESTSPRPSFNFTYRIDCVATTRAQAAQGAALVLAALHHQPLSIAGWSHYDTHADKWFSDITNLEGEQFHLVGAEFKIRADEA